MLLSSQCADERRWRKESVETKLRTKNQTKNKRILNSFYLLSGVTSIALFWIRLSEKATNTCRATSVP
ncbi:hypothetical protein LDENG_00050920 [Lucifuga dentata]|nr:hypothetical protein LDENG_00050920 [Lucifuga dentata]